jgi:hypothetical protein
MACLHDVWNFAEHIEQTDEPARSYIPRWRSKRQPDNTS